MTLVSDPLFPLMSSARLLSSRRKSRGRRPASRHTRESLRRWLLRGVLLFLIVSLLPVIVLRWIAPPTSAVMLVRTLSEGRPQDYQWVPLEHIAPAMALAVVAAEDQKFPDHWGFDIAAIHDAAETRARGGRLRGASTLTQQVARNLFLWQGRSYLRKALEAWMTVLLEIAWPKRRILEVYLNIAEMGERTFGVQAAARRYFARPADAISREQAALLAAVLPNPHHYRVDSPSLYVLERRDWILQQMSQLGDDYLKGILPGRRR
jgi:monofunctional biosynthetic peptidoglycan transglycosylase